MSEWSFEEDLQSLAEQLDRQPLPSLPTAVRQRRPRRSLWPGLAAAGVLGVSVIAALVLVDLVPSGVEPTHGAVSVVPDGVGHVVHDGSRTTIEWTSGVVDVDVEPNRGAQVVVHTPEAEVTVVGTRFQVHRDARGTHVTVDRGLVHVSCFGVERGEFGMGDEAWCLQTAGGALGLALERLDDRDLVGVLEAIDQGLAHPIGKDQTRIVLRALKVQTLADLGREEDALTVAETLLNSTERDALATAARLAWPQGCERARPFLEALVALGDEVAPTLLRRCEP